MLPAKTQLLETQAHQIIKDDAIECIIEKPRDAFPPIERVLHKSVMGQFQFNRIDASMRVALLTALARERNGSYDLLLHLEHDHANPDKIRLKVHRDARWEGSAKLFAVTRGDEATLPSWDGTVDLKDFVRVISYQLGPDYVDCFVLTQKVLLVSLQKDQSVTKAYLSFHDFNIAQPNGDSERNERSS